MKDGQTPKRHPLDQDQGAQLDLLSVTAPPPGYVTEKVLMLTYGLDAAVALAMLASAFRVDQRYIVTDGSPVPLTKNEQMLFIKRILESTLIMAQQADGVPRGAELFRHDLIQLLKDRVFCVARPRRVDAKVSGRSPWVNFHPKLVLARFRNGAQVILRIYIGSKNLTLGTGMEAGVLIETRGTADVHPTDQERRLAARLGAAEVLLPLATYLGGIRQKAVRESDQWNEETVRHDRALADWKDDLEALAKTHKFLFVEPKIDRIQAFCQVPGGKPLIDHLKSDLKQAKSIVIVSPWVDQDSVPHLLTYAPRGRNLRLWTLRSEASKLKSLVGKARRICSSADADLYGDPPGTTDDSHMRDTKLHAKIFAIDTTDGKGALWLGSANWTSPGIGLNRAGEENFELLLRVQLPGRATRWLGELEDDEIVEEETEGDDDEEEESPRDENKRLLIRLRMAWATFPSRLTVFLDTHASEKRTLKAKFKQLEFHVEQTMEGEGEEPSGHTGRCSWNELLAKGQVDVPFKISSSALVDSFIRVTTDLGDALGFVRIHVSLPDAAAKRRLERAKDRIEQGINDIVEGIVALQGGGAGTRGRPPSSRGRTGDDDRDLETFLRQVRLERLYLSLTADGEDAEEGLQMALELAEGFKKLLNKDNYKHRRELKTLLDSLNVIIAQAKAYRAGTGRASHVG